MSFPTTNLDEVLDYIAVFSDDADVISNIRKAMCQTLEDELKEDVLNDFRKLPLDKLEQIRKQFIS